MTLTTILIIILILILIGAVPAWPHSRSWVTARRVSSAWCWSCC